MTAFAAVDIRQERDADAACIDRLLVQAFAGREEADLVVRLRGASDLLLALVAEQESRIVGYLAFPRLRIVHDAGATSTVGLAPLAVTPAHQRRGVGSGLVHEGLSHLRRAGESLVFVLGDPAYYRRFGFAVAGPNFRSPYGGSHFMMLRLRSGAPESGAIRYPAAFADLR